MSENLKRPAYGLENVGLKPHRNLNTLASIQLRKSILYYIYSIYKEIPSNALG